MSPPPPGASLVPPFGPLEGVRVIDSGRFVAGPWAATYLGEFGAEVIHVEGPPFAPPYADPSRTLVPTLPVGAPPDRSTSESWVQYSRNKLSLGLDVRRPEGTAIFLELVRRADIWVESSRPGTYDRLGLSDATLWAANPRLTIVHVSGYGQTGDPGRIGQPSFDLVGQAYSGYLSLQGKPDPEPPMRAGTALNDTVTGLAAAAGALMGYISAQRTGRGQVVDVAQYEVFFALMENLALDYFMRGVARGRHGTGHARLYPYDLFPARDGWVVVAAPTDDSWRKLEKLLGTTVPEWATDAGRRSHRTEIDDRLRAYCGARSVEELERIGRENDVALSGVFDIKRIATDPHFRERGMFTEWDDPVAGRVKGANVAPRFAATPGGSGGALRGWARTTERSCWASSVTTSRSWPAGPATARSANSGPLPSRPATRRSTFGRGCEGHAHGLCGRAGRPRRPSGPSTSTRGTVRGARRNPGVSS